MQMKSSPSDYKKDIVQLIPRMFSTLKFRHNLCYDEHILPIAWRFLMSILTVFHFFAHFVSFTIRTIFRKLETEKFETKTVKYNQTPNFFSLK